MPRSGERLCYEYAKVGLHGRRGEGIVELFCAGKQGRRSAKTSSETLVLTFFLRDPGGCTHT